MTQTANPLLKHFRQPAIYLRLPSGGKHYPPGTLDMPPNNELPVYPMTALDEIVTRTPDALFNGSAIVEIIRSCVPNIRDPWQVPNTDLNALLVAMRLASYGHNMEIHTTCPKCGHQHEFDLDLRVVLETLKPADYQTPMTTGDLTLYFTPLTYKTVNDIGRAQFNDQKITQVINDTELPEEEKMKQMGDAFRRITELTIKSISASIGAVKTADAMVTEPEHILEFVKNCPKPMFDAIRDRVVALRTQSDFKNLDIKCRECAHEYKQEFTLDLSNFFVTNS